ncbi:hypothetical protein AVEN_151407-1 [Araneus ventricosus]|uniref:Uncharacterized protein n=1 Tax=Araneus ventricosus TaxID=182803 RepID=A0A4Y2CAQ1_ARAVE|nr:hypothetical protein AVEN_151407-1 [Araneus ventricosus]
MGMTAFGNNYFFHRCNLRGYIKIDDINSKTIGDYSEWRGKNKSDGLHSVLSLSSHHRFDLLFDRSSHFKSRKTKASKENVCCVEIVDHAYDELV